MSAKIICFFVQDFMITRFQKGINCQFLLHANHVTFFFNELNYIHSYVMCIVERVDTTHIPDLT